MRGRRGGSRGGAVASAAARKGWITRRSGGPKAVPKLHIWPGVVKGLARVSWTQAGQVRAAARYVRLVRRKTGLSGAALGLRAQAGMRAHNRRVGRRLVKHVAKWAVKKVRALVGR